MRIIILTFFSLMFLATEGVTQVRNGMSFGLKGGVNLTSVHNPGESKFKADPEAGFAGGIFLSLPTGTYTAIQAEILFSQRKITATGKMPDNLYYFTRTANYIDLPVFFSATPAPFLTLLAGPQYSYLISKKDVFTRTAVSENVREEFSKEHTRTHTVCIVLGSDVKYNRFVLGVRLGWDLLKNTTSAAGVPPRYTYIWSQVTVGYQFY